MRYRRRAGNRTSVRVRAFPYARYVVVWSRPLPRSPTSRFGGARRGSHGASAMRGAERGGRRVGAGGRRPIRALGAVLALVASAAASCSVAASGDPTDSATVVLFDVSNSTRAEAVRA